jgi:enoyl reductase
VPAIRKLASIATVLTLASVPVFASQVAFAEREKHGSNGQTQQSGNASDDGTLSSTVGAVVFDRSKNGTGASAGPVTSTTSWTPPACWYAPKYSPAGLKAYLEPIWEAESTGSQWDLEQRNKYEKGGDAPGTYKDFNKDKTGKGYWWDSYVNESFPPGWDKCTKPIFR